MKCERRGHQLIRQHNWGLFTFLVLLEQLSWPENTNLSNRGKFRQFDSQNLELQESIICILDDFGVAQHLLIELIDNLSLKDDKENTHKNTEEEKSPPRCLTLIEHNLRKICQQLWNIFSQVNMNDVAI